MRASQLKGPARKLKSSQPVPAKGNCLFTGERTGLVNVSWPKLCVGSLLQLFLGVFVLIFREQRDTQGMKVPLHSSVTCERKITNFVEGHTSQVGLRWLSWRWVLLPSISACHLPHDPRALPLESESSPSDIESRPNPPCDLDLSSLKHASGRLACGPASDAHSRCF